MRKRFFAVLLATCVAISIHFAIDGVQSHRILQSGIEKSAPADLLASDFGIIWTILTGIESVLLILAHRIADGRAMRLLIYACGAAYLAASLFAYLGYLDLHARIAI
jgi:hypothetical protein